MKITPHLTTEELKTRRHNEEREHKKRKRHCLYLCSKNKEYSRNDLWEVVDKHPETIKKLLATYNKLWPKYIDWLEWKWWDRWNKKIDRKREERFFKWIQAEAIAWKHVTARDIEERYEKEVWRKLGKLVIYSVFDRIGWKKKVPRTYHEKKEKME